jgi:hypothetical protein
MNIRKRKRTKMIFMMIAMPDVEDILQEAII